MYVLLRERLPMGPGLKKPPPKPVIAPPPAAAPAVAEVLAPEVAPGASEAPSAAESPLEGTAPLEEAPAPFAQAAGPGFFEEGFIVIAEPATPAQAPGTPFPSPTGIPRASPWTSPLCLPVAFVYPSTRGDLLTIPTPAFSTPVEFARLASCLPGLP